MKSKNYKKIIEETVSKESADKAKKLFDDIDQLHEANELLRLNGITGYLMMGMYMVQ